MSIPGVGAIQQDTLIDYSNSYAKVGHVMLDTLILDHISQKIAQLLPNNYRAVNLGSGDGSETDIFQKEAKALGKDGVFLNVDPYITQENVLKVTGEEFIS